MNRKRLSIRVRGVVQGVGFRPFVKLAADERGIAGFIRNDPDGVWIEAEGSPEEVASFLAAIKTKNPPGSSIHTVEIDELAPHGEALANSFTILESSSAGPLRSSLPPDSAPCPECLREIFDDPAERRHRYPFTNCTRCGPRLTITIALPYDRERTTLREFPLCEACAREHGDPKDRRFHAQPIACPACGPAIFTLSPQGKAINTGESAINTTANALLEGRICALKGVGGYQLLADATNSAAVRLLRTRKCRPDKPLAIMFPSLASLREVAQISLAEEEFLTSPSAPILLVRRKLSSTTPEWIAPETAPNSPYLGAMLPSSPLHHILLRTISRPLVCTSGNLSNEPICTTEAEALERLGEIADLFLAHNRPIARPVDDSVARAGPTGLEILRRARGFCPLPLAVPGGRKTVLALGGHLKSTVALFAGGEITLSQHLGDLDSPLAVSLHEKTTGELLQFFDRRPDIIACDLHPDYASTRLAERLAERFGAGLIRVQHHHAHIAAVMAEHGLDGPVLGLAWDGIGYGENGDLWGGEALVCEGTTARRIATLRPFRLPGGEAAVREGRRAAAGLLFEAQNKNLFNDLARAWFSSEELTIMTRMLERSFNALRTTSIGRLFDAITAIAGGRLRSTFEGQAAMDLEFASLDVPDEPPYPIPLREGSPLEADWEPLLLALLEDRARGAPLSLISARFHAALVDLAVAIADRAGIKNIALAGGCFQNLRLAHSVRSALTSRKYSVYSPAKFPPNDGGLALGQAFVAMQVHFEGKDPSDVSRNSG